MVKADSHRILRNTGALYVRMLLVMAVSLYISRVVLAALGVNDYGIYNVVGGIVVFFSFLTGALSLSIQRFLAADLGRGDLQAARRTFSVSLQVHAVLAVVLLLAAETLGVWFLTTQLNIPAGRMAAAGRVFQFTLLSFVAKLFVVPFNAAVIAHERMSFYAYLSLLEAALNLAAAGLLTLCRGDRLVLYAGLVSAVNLVVLGAYVLFCRSRYDCCRPAPVRDRALFRRILSFSGWNTLGGAANVCVQQGLNFLLNIFCGVAVNAAWAVTGQVTAGVTSLVGSFQTAANPQIVKTCPGGVRSGFFALVLRPRGSPTSSCCSLPSRCCSVRRLSFSCGSSNPRPTACRSSASCCSFPWSRPSRDRSGWAYRPRATSAATSRCSAASCCSTCPLRGCCCVPAARRRRSWRCASRSMWRRSACGSTSLPAARDFRAAATCTMCSGPQQP